MFLPVIAMQTCFLILILPVPNRLALEKELERDFKYEIDNMNGNVDILSVSPTKMEWKYDDGDIISFRKRITE